MVGLANHGKRERNHPMTQVTILTNQHGDFELHMGGCGDIPKASRRYPERVQTFEGIDLVAALVALDEDAADWFCEEPYTQASRDAGCWSTTNGFTHAPCLVKARAAAKIAFDSNGRPFVQTTPDTGAGKCRGKWSTCGGKNGAKSESWHLCKECTAKRAAR